MKHIFSASLLILLFVSCGKEQDNMIVQGTIKGLQKGTLHLQKLQDTLLISVDSLSLNGSNDFVLSYTITEPEIFYLTLDKKEEEKIEFFGEQGTITINSKLERFATSAVVSGSGINDILGNYQDMINQFNGKRLDLLKASFEAQKEQDTALVAQLEEDVERLEKNRLRFSTTFALRNSDSEVAPFIALTDLYNAHITLLDTVNNSLSDRVRASKYGVKLDNYILDIKAE